MQNDNSTKNDVRVCSIFSKSRLASANCLKVDLSFIWAYSEAFSMTCLESRVNKQQHRKWVRRGKPATDSFSSNGLCSSIPTLFTFVLPLNPLSLRSFSPHLFPALLLWLPVSSWPGAQPPLGSIPHPEPTGREGSKGGEKRRRTNGRNERKNHSGTPYIECDVIYLWPRWGGEEQFLLQIVCRFPAFSLVVNLPFLFIDTSSHF